MPRVRDSQFPRNLRTLVLSALTNSNLLNAIRCDNYEVVNPDANHFTGDTSNRNPRREYRTFKFPTQSGCLRGWLRVESGNDITFGNVVVCNIELPIPWVDGDGNYHAVIKGYQAFKDIVAIHKLKELCKAINRGEITNLGEFRYRYLTEVLSIEVPTHYHRATNPTHNSSSSAERSVNTSFSRIQTSNPLNDIENIIREYNANRMGSYHSHRNCRAITKWCGDSDEITIGFEHELNSVSTEGQVAIDIINNSNLRGRFYYESDSSLTGYGIKRDTEDVEYEYGIECITHPMSVSEFFNTDWQPVWDKLIEAGFRASESGRCGMHTHVLRTAFGINFNIQVLNLAKIQYFMNEEFKEFKKLLGRGEANYAQWNRGLSIEELVSLFKEAEKDRLENPNSWRYHSNGINFQHPKTFEFRFPCGTLKSKRYKAIVDTILVLAKNSQHIESTATVAEWLKGVRPETKEYYNSRGIFSDASTAE